jgi:hypothetical protein
MQTIIIEVYPVSLDHAGLYLTTNNPIMQHYASSISVSIFAKENKETQKLNADLQTRRTKNAKTDKHERAQAMEGTKAKRDPSVRNLLGITRFSNAIVVVMRSQTARHSHGRT